MKTILLDQNIFDDENNSTKIFKYLREKEINTYMLMNMSNIEYENIPNYLNGIIYYTKEEIRKKTLNLIYKIINDANITKIDETLIVTSDQELIKAFETTNFKTCLIYKNMWDCMDTSSTYELPSTKHLIKMIK